MNGSDRNRTGWTTLALVCGCLLGSGAVAQEASGDEAVPEELELTMKLMPVDADLPDAVTRTIELPPATSARAVEASERGLSTVNAAKQNRQDGLDTAAEARERGREFGEAMAEQARQNRGDAGRGNAPPAPPAGPPDHVPAPPDPPRN